VSKGEKHGSCARNTVLVREMEIEDEQVYITNESKGEGVHVTQRKRVCV